MSNRNRAGRNQALQWISMFLGVITVVVPTSFLLFFPIGAGGVIEVINVMILFIGLGTLTGASFALPRALSYIERIDRRFDMVELRLQEMSRRPVTPSTPTPQVTATHAGEISGEQLRAMMESVRTYIDLEMWSLAVLKSRDLIHHAPMSPEAEKLRRNLPTLEQKAREMENLSTQSAPKTPVGAPLASRGR